MLTGIALLKGQRGCMLWLAAQMGMQPSTLSGWTVVPARHVHRIEKLTGLPRYMLRPDLWAPPWAREDLWFARHAKREGE